MLDTMAGQSTLPMISMRGVTIQQLSQQILGHRQDENCNLNRKALMIEKANRLGEQMTKKREDDNKTKKDGNTSIEAYLSNELGRRQPS